MFTAAAGGARRPLCTRVGGRLPWPPPSAVREVTLAATLHTAWVPGNALLPIPAHQCSLLTPSCLPATGSPCSLHMPAFRFPVSASQFPCPSPSLHLSLCLCLSLLLSLFPSLSHFVSASPSISVSVCIFLSPPSLCLSLSSSSVFLSFCPSLLGNKAAHTMCVK